jgi:hypothetical protein
MLQKITEMIVAVKVLIFIIERVSFLSEHACCQFQLPSKLSQLLSFIHPNKGILMISLLIIVIVEHISTQIYSENGNDSVCVVICGDKVNARYRVPRGKSPIEGPRTD